MGTAETKQWKIAGWVCAVIVVLWIIGSLPENYSSNYEIKAQASVRMYMDEYLKDPGSYKPQSWDVTKTDTGYKVRHRYRAKNGFGGYVLEELTFELDNYYNVITVY